LHEPHIKALSDTGLGMSVTNDVARSCAHFRNGSVHARANPTATDNSPRSPRATDTSCPDAMVPRNGSQVLCQQLQTSRLGIGHSDTDEIGFHPGGLTEPSETRVCQPASSPASAAFLVAKALGSHASDRVLRTCHFPRWFCRDSP
jgi:hypothetical protein